MVPLPPNLISSCRRQRSGNLLPWFWTTSCSACSWPFASSGRSPSLLEGSSSSTCCEVTEREEIICIIRMEVRLGDASGVAFALFSHHLWKASGFVYPSLDGSYLKSVLSPTIFPLFNLFCFLYGVLLLQHTLVGSMSVFLLPLCKHQHHLILFFYLAAWLKFESEDLIKS